MDRSDPLAARRRATDAACRAVQVLAGSHLFADELDDLPVLDLEDLPDPDHDPGTCTLHTGTGPGPVRADRVDWRAAAVDARAHLRRLRLHAVR